MGLYEQQLAGGVLPSLPGLKRVYPEVEPDGPTPVVVYQVLPAEEAPRQP